MMGRDKVLDMIYQNKIIAIIRGVSQENIEDVIQALLDGGVNMAEITFDHTDEIKREETLNSLRKIQKSFEERICLGAGTVLTEKDVEDAYQAGADYMISPNTNEAVIRKTRELGMVSIPGAFSPSEIVMAYQAGADIVKLFPAALMGVEYIKALMGPLHHIPMSAVGGVTPESIKDFVKAGICCFGIGSNLVSAKNAEAGDFTAITNSARQFHMAVEAL